jgi:hypothetical protein
MAEWTADERALAAAEDRIDSMDAKALAAEVTRLVEDSATLHGEDPAWLSALIKTVDLEPRRLPKALRERFGAALLGLPSPVDLTMVLGLPAEVRRAQEPVGAQFRTKVSELVDASIDRFLRTGRDPWMVFAERLTSHLLDVEHAQRTHSPACGPDRSSQPLLVGEIAAPRIQPPHEQASPASSSRGPLTTASAGRR